MIISVFEMFKIGIGPSSSHTVGPMVAACRFASSLEEFDGRVSTVKIHFYGSLALTGKGHWSDKAVILGLSGEEPHLLDPDHIEPILDAVNTSKQLKLNGQSVIDFDAGKDIFFEQRKRLPFHSNAMKFEAFDEEGRLLLDRLYYSVGGGFVLDEFEAGRNSPRTEEISVPFPFSSAKELLEIGQAKGLKISDIMLANERERHSQVEIEDGLDRIWQVMDSCIERGCVRTGRLPGVLNVPRRAPGLFQSLKKKEETGQTEPLSAMDWINLWAIAVNEENASGGQVVTAPTNGAAGILPAVLRYYHHFCQPSRQGLHDFLLTAAAVGALYKTNASISGAEVGCQGEVGVACSMAAAGLTAALGGTNEQIENAAEIGMEHNLGLTCDPIAGLVQIPCIERNAMGAIKAVDASRLALLGDGTHMVSLDKVIETMRETGLDMKAKYKETSKGGLAVNVVEC